MASYFISPIHLLKYNLWRKTTSFHRKSIHFASQDATLSVWLHVSLPYVSRLVRGHSDYLLGSPQKNIHPENKSVATVPLEIIK